jgi:hypothetical protein
MIQFEDKTYQDKKQALNALAFCHYPVKVTADGKEHTFHSFDDAREWVESLPEEN